MTANDSVPPQAESAGRRLVGYRCRKDYSGGVIPLSAYSDPCPFDVPVYVDGPELGISPPKSKFLRLAHWLDDRGWHRLAAFVWRFR